MGFWRNVMRRWRTEPVLSVVPKGDGLRVAAYKAEQQTVERKQFPIRLPDLPPRVVPAGAKSGIAMDENFASCATSYAPLYSQGLVNGFPGYPYLAALATRAEYRAMAEGLAKQLTREWITINSSETAGDSTKQKVTELTKKVEDINLKGVIRTAAEHDAYYGRGQILVDVGSSDRSLPLIISEKTIAKGSFKGVKTVEPMWTTPVAYNALDAFGSDFYKPSKWFVLGKQIHASRLLTTVTRPISDIFKPAFNFSGMSLSQLAEPYVDNWLRTRQSVSDLVSNFSVTALATSMDEVLDGSADGTDLFSRAALFTATRSNKGLMLLDKEREELIQVNVPLSGLSELQAQAQEHMCAVSHLPAMILTGISPTGLNASSDGEIRAFYDWIAGEQEAHWRAPIESVLKVLQLSMYGEIDPDITFSFVSLYQMTPKELADIRTADANTAAAYIDRGVIDPLEERERLARLPKSGYQGLKVEDLPDKPGEEDDDDDKED